MGLFRGIKVSGAASCWSHMGLGGLSFPGRYGAEQTVGGSDLGHGARWGRIKQCWDGSDGAGVTRGNMRSL